MSDKPLEPNETLRRLAVYCAEMCKRGMGRFVIFTDYDDTALRCADVLTGIEQLEAVAEAAKDLMTDLEDDDSQVAALKRALKDAQQAKGDGDESPNRG